MDNQPLYTGILFGFTIALAIFLFYRATNRSSSGLLIISVWLLLQAILSLSGFYRITDTAPPRILLLGLPPLLFIIALFFTVRGRNYIDLLNPALLCLLHIVRIPMEIVLYWLFLDKQVPQLMTFAGGNYDIISGLTAPVIYYFGFIKKVFDKKIILGWNFICLGLLLWIVVHAILSIPSPIQQLAFAQPNIAVLYFPYTLLPAVVVPLVLFSHLASIRILLKEKIKS
jgi:hypothetical protein